MSTQEVCKVVLSDTIRRIGKLHKVSCDHGTTERIVQS